MEIHVWSGGLKVEARNGSGWTGPQCSVGRWGDALSSEPWRSVAGLSQDGIVVALAGVTGDTVCRMGMWGGGSSELPVG